MFVILVCSVSYFGYFLSRFAGPTAGAKLAGVLGGIASSTAATAVFARASRAPADEAPHAAGAATLANATQFLRILLLLYFFDARLAQSCQWTLVAMAAAGGVIAQGYWRGAQAGPGKQAPMRNPLSLTPALKFGALLTAVLFVSKLSLVSFGGQSLPWLSAIAGLADADAVLLPAAELHRQGAITSAAATLSVLLALAANAITKSIIAFTGGTKSYALRVFVAFVGMFGAGWAVLLFQAASAT